MSPRLLRTKLLFRHQMHGCIAFSTMKPKVATVGIDFGCRNSRVAIVDSLVPKVLDCESWSVTPSYVTLTNLDDGVRNQWALQRLGALGYCAVVGLLAKRKMLVQPSNVVFNIKKLIGKQFDDHYVQEMRKKYHFSIIEGERGEAWVEISGMKFSPVDIASVIFAKLQDIVLAYQFYHELKVVISVPAFFNEQQREDIVLAGNKAGLKILHLIDEPIAAALSSTTIKEGTVVVFGMGAGSYNVSILGVSGTNVEIKTQFDDPCVGGDQFDDILLDYVVRQIMKFRLVDIRGDKYAMILLAEAVEQAKMELSSQHEVTVSLPCPGDPDLSICRTEFEKLVVNLIEQIQDKCQTLLKLANITDKDIDEVVLTGGMTRVPMIQKLIYEVFGKHPTTSMKHEEAVVIGSAIQAALIIEDQREVSEGMIPLSIGIESAGTFMPVIPRHTIIPTKRTVNIPAWCAYGECLRVKVFVGEHVVVHHNVFVGEVELINNQTIGEERLCQGSVHLELTFEVDENYVLKVSSRNADNQLEAADCVRNAFKVFPIREIVMCKHKVDKAVEEALLDWRMGDTVTAAHLIRVAKHTANTLNDVLSVRMDEVPKDIYGDAAKALADLLVALDGDPIVLKVKILAAQLAERRMLEWEPPSESDIEYSD